MILTLLLRVIYQMSVKILKKFKSEMELTTFVRLELEFYEIRPFLLFVVYEKVRREDDENRKKLDEKVLSSFINHFISRIQDPDVKKELSDFVDHKKKD